MGIAMVKQIPTLGSSAHNYGEMYGMAWHGMAWHGMAWYGMVCMVCNAMQCNVRTQHVCVYLFIAGTAPPTRDAISWLEVRLGAAKCVTNMVILHKILEGTPVTTPKIRLLKKSIGQE